MDEASTGKGVALQMCEGGLSARAGGGDWTMRRLTVANTFSNSSSDRAMNLVLNDLLPPLTTQGRHAALDLSDDEVGDVDGFEQGDEQSSLHAEQSPGCELVRA